VATLGSSAYSSVQNTCQPSSHFITFHPMEIEFHVPSTYVHTRCVSHTFKECVGYHKLKKNFVVVHLNFRKSLTEIPRNGCGTMWAAAVTWQSPISPQMFLQTGLGRASTRQLSQPPGGGDWGLSRYSRRPHRPTPISRNFSERFSKIQVYHTQKFS